ncbi:MAG: hypothetical protein EBU46_00150 [Nitrosomonadaceae bacterium]|nr:hypothetical protein [Nitrosomonadaceae bacterium]
MKTPQEIFDVVSTHMLTQRQVARAATTKQCMYKTEEGLKCAVGCLINEADYNPLMEKAGSLINFDQFNLYFTKVEALTEKEVAARLIADALKANEVDILDQNVKSLLIHLQSLHDNQDVCHWRSSLQTIALNHHLNYNHPEL